MAHGPSGRAVFLAFAALAALTGGAAWFLLRGDGPSLPVLEGSTAQPEGEQAELGPDAAVRAERAAEQAPAPREPAAAPPGYEDLLGAVTGRVLEADGQPVAELQVSTLHVSFQEFALETSALLDEELIKPDFIGPSTVTDEEGRFLLRGLEPRSVQLLAVDLGGARSTVRFLDHQPAAGETVDVGDIVLDLSVTFLGRVLDENREPVPGARVRATNLPMVSMGGSFGLADIRADSAIMAAPEELSPMLYEIPSDLFRTLERVGQSVLRIPTTQTDAEGRFRLEGVPIGVVTAIADKPGFLGLTKGGIPSGRRPERNIGDLYLGRGFTLEGRIVDGEGEGKPGLEVRAGISPNGVPLPAAVLQPAGRTKGDGSFSLRGLPEGKDAYVAFRRSFGQPWSIHGPFPVAGDVRVELPSVGRARVRLLTDAAEVVPEAELFITPDDPFPVPPLLAPPMQRLGQVEWLEEGYCEIRGLDHGKYRLLGRAEDLALARTEIEIGQDTGEFELTFESGHGLDVRVIRAGNQRPVEWTFVSISPKGILEQPLDRGRTDADGRVRLQRLPAGEYLVSVMHPAQASRNMEIAIPYEAEELLVELSEGGHLKGRVHDAGEPPDKRVFFAAFPRGTWHPTDAPTFSASTDDGDFAVPNLDPGEYGYMVRDRIVGQGALALILTMQDDPLAEGSFEIHEGETTVLDIDISGIGDGPSATLVGSVWINGNPAEGVSISHESRLRRPGESSSRSSRRTVMTDESGRFEFDAVPAGEGLLEMRRPEEGNFFSVFSTLHRQELELMPGEAREVNFELMVSTVSGRVTGPGVLPTGPGTVAMLERQGGGGMRRGRGPAGGPGLFSPVNPLTGFYEIKDVPEGDYTLRVRKRGAVPYSSEVTVRGDVVADVELQAAVALSGTFEVPPDIHLTHEADPEDQGQRRGRRGPRGDRGTFLVLESDAGPTRMFGNADAEAGTFRFREAAAGEYRATLRVAGTQLVSQPFEVPPGGADDFHLVFQRPPPPKDTPGAGDG